MNKRSILLHTGHKPVELIAMRCCGCQKYKCLQRQLHKSWMKSVLRTVTQKMQQQLSPQEIPALQLLQSESIYQGKYHSI